MTKKQLTILLPCIFLTILTVVAGCKQNRILAGIGGAITVWIIFFLRIYLDSK